MKIYYNSSLWRKGKGLRGWIQRTNWQFEDAGMKRYIPAIYRFSRGIVFDVITIIDETKLRKFFEKYEDIEETLTPLHKLCVEQEHPYQAVPISKIWINGKQVEGGYPMVCMDCHYITAILFQVLKRKKSQILSLRESIQKTMAARSIAFSSLLDVANTGVLVAIPM